MTDLIVNQTYAVRDGKFVEVPNTLDYSPLAFRDESDGLLYFSGLDSEESGQVIRDKETGEDILEFIPAVEDVVSALSLDGDLRVAESLDFTYIFLSVDHEITLEPLGYTLAFFK